MKVILSTKNRNKVREFDKIAEKYDLDIVTRDEAGVPDIDIVEDGATFEENSFKKAFGIFEIAGEATMADDSGLVVDALDGAPGIFSARFGGDEPNNAKLLRLMQDVPSEARTAKFVCVITLLIPKDGIGGAGYDKIVARGECKGHIIFEERGSNGFGYDPLFVPDGYDKTFSELPADVKNGISHRANALFELERKLIACGIAK